MATFTAFNGGSPKAGSDGSMPSAGSAEPNRSRSPENTDGPAPRADQQQQRARDQNNGLPEVHVSRPEDASRDHHNEVSPTPGQGQRETWATRSPTREGYATGATSSERPTTWSSGSYAETDNSHKRKRSDDSTDGSRRGGPMQMDREQDDARTERPELSEPREQRDHDYRSYGDEIRGRERDSESWYSHEGRGDKQPYSQPASAVPDSATNDEQMELLRRATERTMDPDEYSQASPDGDDRSMSFQYTPEQRRDGVVQSEKKRKRNFSNRTKTGCLTCRKRKKKCDEAKPECANCLKGGFVCAGYPQQRGTWPKPENKAQAIQIESKDPTYKPPGAYGMPQQAPFASQQPPALMTQQKREAAYRGQPLRIEPPQGRPMLTDDDRPTASTLPSASVTSPDANKLSALTTAYTNTPGNVFPTPVSAAPVPFPERTGPKEYQRVPPLHDLTRTEHEMTPQSTTLPHINIMRATRTNSPIGGGQSSAAQTTAQLALSHTTPQQFPSGPSPTGAPGNNRHEKSEMLAGRPFYPFERELVLERERCSAAQWRFNNSTNPNNGVSPAERARLFREILQPREGVQLSPTQTAPITHAGRVGENVVVEANFTCDYGYNIQIGKNTLIGRSCTILDACEVIIGNNVVIGPNVSLYTTTMTTHPSRRNGASGTCQGKSIVIEDDVFIGGNVTILDGVRIGRGTTVGAGSLVTKTQPTYCIVTGSPAKVMRGIASPYP